VLVEDITDQPKSGREEEDADATEVGTSVMGQKRKKRDAMEITIPYLLDTVITLDGMLGKVPRLRYADHDVQDAAKFPALAEKNYLINTGEIGPSKNLS
jgi:hypothetical protein